MVDGVYDRDPRKHADARRFDTITYDKVLADHLGVMDATAIAHAQGNDLPIIVFSLDEPGGFRGVVLGKGTYTTVCGSGNRGTVPEFSAEDRARPVREAKAVVEERPALARPVDDPPVEGR